MKLLLLISLLTTSLAAKRMKFFLLIALLVATPLHANLCRDVAAMASLDYDSAWDNIDLKMGHLKKWITEHAFPNSKTKFLATIAAINGTLLDAALVPPGFRSPTSPHPTVEGVFILDSSNTNSLALRMEIRHAWSRYFQENASTIDLEKLWEWAGHNVKAKYVARGFNWAFFEEDPYGHIEPEDYREMVLSASQTEETPHLAHHRILDHDGLKLGYLSIRTFVGRAVPRYVASSIDAIRKSGAKGIIVDLRRNGGGGLDEANQIAGYFVGKKQILIHRQPVTGGLRRPELTFTARRIDLPIVVLVDGGTASAAEVLAGNLQHHQNAYLVGEPTYGKGTILLGRHVSNEPGPFLNLPLIWTKTAEIYYLPSLRSPQIHGVPVDFVVENGKTFLREGDIPTALANTDGPVTLREDPLREKLRSEINWTLPEPGSDVIPVDKQLFFAQVVLERWLSELEH